MAPEGEEKEAERVGLSEWLLAILLHPVTLISVGSIVGGNLRYFLGRWVDSLQWAGGLPWGTFLINVTGSFLLGFFGVAFVDRVGPGRREAYLLLGVGLCGSYTTFSTFEWETLKLIRDGSWWAALLNVVGSVLAGFAAVVAGAVLARLLFGRE
jgi:CrcB protein